ncbi:MAG: hypothetical protein HW401_209 [Parcubacteria group bacterium]|nr:hypothetical protein [Parcubacteria group bacterium]
MVLIVVLMIIAYVIKSKEKKGKKYYLNIFLGQLASVAISFIIALFAYIIIGDMGIKWEAESSTELANWPNSYGSSEKKYLKKEGTTHDYQGFIVLKKVFGETESERIIIGGDVLNIFPNSDEAKLIKWVAPKRKILFPGIFPINDSEHVRYDAHIPAVPH